MRRFYTYTEDNERRVWLKATNLDDAITEVENADHLIIGQIADVYERFSDDLVAVSINVLG